MGGCPATLTREGWLCVSLMGFLTPTSLAHNPLPFLLSPGGGIAYSHFHSHSYSYSYSYS
jgi:hypothetical protein